MPGPPFQIEPWIRCLHCGAGMGIQDHYMPAYFDGQPITCLKCQAPLDWWATLLREVRENFMLNQAFAPIGARQTLFSFTLHPRQRTHYNLSAQGVPPDAKILYVNYTPGGPDHRRRGRRDTPVVAAVLLGMVLPVCDRYCSKRLHSKTH